jgi:NAD(P)-dependent dehydrogenase (short-subunit alcohol dehydrogenase family)
MGATPILTGRVCMVTGATSGIGAVTARELGSLGATVVLVGRDAGRCARQADAIARATGAPVAALVADLSSQRQVRELADAFEGRFPRLDVLVNNAGACFARRRLTVDGIEMTLALNHLAPFLLTALLLPSLRRSGSARVVNVSSVAHTRATLEDLEDLQGARRYDRLAAYGRSKLAILLFTHELARRLEGTGVTANAVDPGLVATNLGIDDGWLRVKLRNLLRRELLSPEEGARTTLHVASAPQLEGVTGRYFRECREVRPSDASRDPAAAARLWEESERLTGLRDAAPRVPAVAAPGAATATPG